MRSFYCVYSLVVKPTTVLNIPVCAVAQIINYIHNRNVIDDISYRFAYNFSQEISYVIIINYKKSIHSRRIWYSHILYRAYSIGVSSRLAGSQGAEGSFDISLLGDHYGQITSSF